MSVVPLLTVIVTVLAVAPLGAGLTAGLAGRQPTMWLALPEVAFGPASAFLILAHIDGVGSSAWFSQAWAFAVLLALGAAVLVSGVAWSRVLVSSPWAFAVVTVCAYLAGMALVVMGASEAIHWVDAIHLPHLGDLPALTGARPA